MHVTIDKPDQVEQHFVNEEVVRQTDLREQHRSSQIPSWQFVFSPDDFKKKFNSLETASWGMSDK